MTQDIKSALDESNKLIHQIQSHVEAKADASTVARIETDLAKALSKKSALEARLNAVETAQARPGFAGKTSDDETELKAAFIDYARNPNDYSRKAAYEALAKKSINTATPADGGVALPKTIGTDILMVAANFSPIRALARNVLVANPNYKETLAGMAASGWTGETGTRAVTNTPAFTEIAPTFGELYAVAEVSNHAMNDLFFDIPGFITSRIAEKFAEDEGAAFISGNGADKPTGMLNGTTLATTKTGVAANFGANPYDNLIDLMFAVKSAYAVGATFLMNSLTLAQLVKVRDTTGNYIYQPSLAVDVPATLLGKGLAIDENMPGVGAGLKPVVYGNLNKGYIVADVVGMSIIPDNVTKKGYTQFYVSKRVGGCVSNAEALRALVCSV